MSAVITFESVTSPDDLVAVRKAMGFTQPEMAEQMGLSKSAYVAIETGASPMRRLHQLAAERVCLDLAARALNPFILPTALRNDAERVTKSFYAWLGPDKFTTVVED